MKVSVVYKGKVQGVGFRFTVCELARQNNVRGYVKNLPDKSVELVAEGDEERLLNFIHEIDGSRLKRYIVEKHIEWKSADYEFSNFGIKY